jgi:hypothetical protein
MELFNHIRNRALVFLCKGESRYSLSGRRVEGIDGFEILLYALLLDYHLSASDCSSYEKAGPAPTPTLTLPHPRHKPAGSSTGGGISKGINDSSPFGKGGVRGI